eukprot:15365096-Ditylum_brightwellii.AAC.1
MDEAKDRRVMNEQVMEEIKTSEENIAVNQKKIAEEKAQLDMDDAQHVLEVLQREYLITEQDRQEGMACIDAGKADICALEKRSKRKVLKQMQKFLE